MDLTKTIPTGMNNDWMPAPPKEDDVNRRYIRAHLDSKQAAHIFVQRIENYTVLGVTQTTNSGTTEDVKVFFASDNVENQLDLADALEEIAERLRDQASASIAEFLADLRRQHSIHEAIERANDASGFDSGVELASA